MLSLPHHQSRRFLRVRQKKNVSLTLKLFLFWHIMLVMLEKFIPTCIPNRHFIKKVFLWNQICSQRFLVRSQQLKLVNTRPDLNVFWVQKFLESELLTLCFNFNSSNTENPWIYVFNTELSVCDINLSNVCWKLSRQLLRDFSNKKMLLFRINSSSSTCICS